MSLNAALAARLEEIARLLELAGADSFRASAHARAARAIESLPVDIASIAGDRAALLEIEGVGPRMADKIAEFASTGRIAEREELLAQIPPGLPELLRVPGLGPKTIRALWQQAGVASLADLRARVADGSLAGVPRMGAKTVENIRKALEFLDRAGDRTAMGLALPLARLIVERIAAVPGVERAAYAGSLRRGRDTVGDVDVLAAAEADAAERAAEAFRALPMVRQVLAAGASKSSVRAAIAGREIQVDLRVVPPASFGAALLYFTGSKEFNVRLRQRALARGMTLNEYGLYPDDGDPAPPHARGVRAIASRAERDIFAALGMPIIPPELREDRGETELPASHEFGLIDVADVRAELHAHTTASDGAMTIVELARAAKARGMHTIAVTDHSRSQTIAGGLDRDRLLAHIDAVHAARAEVPGIQILAGSEVDILPDGSLDYDDETLARLDIVVASPHAALRQSPEEATERLVRAASHPLVHILGHPTGRFVLEREGLSPDIARLTEAAAAHGTALEINANWRRLDLRDAHARAALDAGCLLAVDCDVHSPDDFDQLEFGVATARRAGLTPERCLNAWPAERLLAWLAAKRDPSRRPAAAPRSARKPAPDAPARKKAARKPPRPR